MIVPIVSTQPKNSVVDALWRIGVLTVLMAFAQAGVAVQFSLYSGHPDLLLAAVGAVAVLRGELAAALSGFFGGLILDLTVFGTVGLSSLLLTLAGTLFGRFIATRTLGDGGRLLSLFFLALFFYLSQGIVLFLLGAEVNLGFLLLDVAAPSAALTALISPPMFWFATRLLPPVQKDTFFVAA